METNRRTLTPVTGRQTPAELVDKWEAEAERYRTRGDYNEANLMSLCALELRYSLSQEKSRPAQTETITTRLITWGRR